MVDFTATFKSTAITFAFREDPADISFNEASVRDLTTPSGNLLTNCDFTGGVYTDNGNPFTPLGCRARKPHDHYKRQRRRHYAYDPDHSRRPPVVLCSENAMTYSYLGMAQPLGWERLPPTEF